MRALIDRAKKELAYAKLCLGKKKEFSDRKDQAVYEAFRYLRKKHSVTRGGIAGNVYDTIRNLDSEVLEDPQLAAGLQLLVWTEMFPFAFVPMMGVKVTTDDNEQKLQQGIEKISKFFGRDDNYKSALLAAYKKNDSSN